MANNTLINKDRDYQRIKFFDGQVGSGSSDWWEGSLYTRGNFHCTGGLEVGGTIQIMGSNAESQPSSATDSSILLTLTPTVLMGTTTERSRWHKVKKISAAGSLPSTVIAEYTKG